MNKPWLLFAALAACAPDDIDKPIPPVERHDVATITSNLDVLVVVDDSGSMADKQNAFNRAFPALLAQLQAADGGLPNLHVGVVSTDLGTSAAGKGEPGPPIGAVGAGGCAGFGKAGNLLVGNAPVTGKFINASRDGARNFAGTLEAAFSQMASLGAAGCGFEQQLGAMRTALDNNANNAGFVRASANLGVIVLSDEDDCSAADASLYTPGDTTGLGNLDSFRCFRFGVECAEDTGTLGVKTQCRPRTSSPHVSDVAPFRDFLLGLKGGEARRILFSALVGDTTKVEVETRMINGTNQIALAHSCRYPTPTIEAVADPGVRFTALASTFPGPTKMTSICADDLAPQATQLGQSLRALVNDTCLAAPLANTDCVLVDHRDSDSTFTQELPTCDDTAGDCIRIIDDATCAGTQRVEIKRSAPASFDTWSTLRCAK